MYTSFRTALRAVSLLALLGIASVVTAQSLDVRIAPKSITAGAAAVVTVNYQAPAAGIVQVQLFDKNWKKVNQRWSNVPKGANSKSLSIAVPAGITGSGYLWQALLYDANWKKQAERFVYNVAVGTGAPDPEPVGSPAITNISNGAEIDPDQVFNFAANGTVVNGWWLRVGTSANVKQHYDSDRLDKSVTSHAASNLPAGKAVVVTLYHRNSAGQWLSTAYNVTVRGAPGPSEPPVTPGVPAITNISDGGTIERDQNFALSANGATVNGWIVRIGASRGSREIHDSKGLPASATSHLVEGLPAGQLVHVTLFHKNASRKWIAAFYSVTVAGGPTGPTDPTDPPGDGFVDNMVDGYPKPIFVPRSGLKQVSGREFDVTEVSADANGYRVIDGYRIQNVDNTCIKVGNNVKNVIIRNSVIGPCRGDGIRIHTGADDVTIENNYIFESRTMVKSNNAGSLYVYGNEFKNPKGPYPHGKHVLVSLPNRDSEIEIVNNRGLAIIDEQCYNDLRNDPSVARGSYRYQECTSATEDLINIYGAQRSAGDPRILIQGNQLRGGGPSKNSCGILSDGGSDLLDILDNIIVNTGQCGITISSGSRSTIDGNIVYGKQQNFTNVGIAVSQTSSPLPGEQGVNGLIDYPCRDNDVTNNRVSFICGFNIDGEMRCGTTGRQNAFDYGHTRTTDDDPDLGHRCDDTLEQPGGADLTVRDSVLPNAAGLLVND